jgi:prepilin-type N-terminal cleavage/methylation domain-containing protein
VFSRHERRLGFTLLELLVVIGIILILALLAIPIYSGLRGRAQRIQCLANLRGLYVATNTFIQQNGVWPQVNTTANHGKSDEEKANLWIAALEPFGINRKGWICPTIQDLLRNPDYEKPENARVDYVATPFDDKPTTPHQWPRQPWFIEVGDAHGGGNLIIFADGSTSDIHSVAKTAGTNP